MTLEIGFRINENILYNLYFKKNEDTKKLEEIYQNFKEVFSVISISKFYSLYCYPLEKFHKNNEESLSHGTVYIINEELSSNIENTKLRFVDIYDNKKVFDIIDYKDFEILFEKENIVNIDNCINKEKKRK